MDLNTKISDMTLGELLDALGLVMRQDGPSTVSGLSGIAEIFGVSLSTAKRIKASGIINKAISQSGRVIVTDVQMARQLYSQATHAHRR